MLDEAEWELVVPLLVSSLSEIKRHRQEHNASILETRSLVDQPALVKYRELTGFNETNVNALWHHQINLYGPPCTSCGKPLRTPKASFCAACGSVRA
ncbi:MAG TPA: hypothetical protein VF471_16980 [Pseudoxanthomonas sp.]